MKPGGSFWVNGLACMIAAGIASIACGSDSSHRSDRAGGGEGGAAGDGRLPSGGGSDTDPQSFGGGGALPAVSAGVGGEPAGSAGLAGRSGAGEGGAGGNSEPAMIDCDPITFTDANLEQAVRNALAQPTGDITLADVADLKQLNARGYGVELLDGIQCLSGLTHVDLGVGGAFSEVKDLSPLAALKNLLSLNLQGCPLEDLTPLGKLPRLTNLYLERALGSDVDLAPLAQAPALVELTLESNELGDLSPLGQIATLQTLFLSFSTLSVPTSAAQLQQVAELYAIGVFSDVTPLGALTQLAVLDVGYIPLTNTSALSTLVNLSHLDIGSAGISSASFVSAMTKLEYLSLASNQISDLAPLQGLTALESLYLNANPISSLAPLAANTGIDTGDVVSLTGISTLSCENEAANIKAIKDRGAVVLGNPCP